VVDAAISEHVVGGGVLLPGVGYVEMAMAFSRASQPALDALRFLRPYALPSLEGGPLAKRRPALLYSEQVDGAFEMASSMGTPPAASVTHAAGRQQSRLVQEEGSRPKPLEARSYLPTAVAMPREQTADSAIMSSEAWRTPSSNSKLVPLLLSLRGCTATETSKGSGSGAPFHQKS